MISYIGNLEKLLKRKKRGFWFAPPPLLGFYKSLWFNGFNSLRGQTHAMKFCLRRLMMTVDSGVHSDQPKIFSFFFMAIDYFWLENFDGHAKLCHLSIRSLSDIKTFVPIGLFKGLVSFKVAEFPQNVCLLIQIS